MNKWIRKQASKVNEYHYLQIIFYFFNYFFMKYRKWYQLTVTQASQSNTHGQRVKLRECKVTLHNFKSINLNLKFIKLPYHLRDPIFTNIKQIWSVSLIFSLLESAERQRRKKLINKITRSILNTSGYNVFTKLCIL